jgi:hypothetical protein
MVKNVFVQVSSFHSDALVLLGWLCFTSGVTTVEPLWLKLFLLATARVLP